MDPAERARTMARAITETVNCLAVFLCGPALESVRADAPALLQQWEAEYAPVFRDLPAAPRGGDLQALRSAVAALSRLAASGVDLGSAEQVRALRALIRQVFAAIALPLPTVPPGEAAICELHGAACPVRAADGG